MAIAKLKKFKISTTPDIGKVNTLKVGDIVMRQYFDSKNMLSSIMYVHETGSEKHIVDGVEKPSHFFVGSLLYGDEPKNGELLDFVRVTNLIEPDREGALYLTSSDEDSPFMDVISGFVSEHSEFFPNKVGTGGYQAVDNSTKVSFSKYSKDRFRVGRFTHSGKENYVGMTHSATMSNSGVWLVSFKASSSKATTATMSIDADMNTEIKLTAKPTTFFFPVTTLNIGEKVRKILFECKGLTAKDDYFELSDFSITELKSIVSFSNATKLRAGKLNGINDEAFGKLNGYGIYSQNIYATKNANIAGTLIAGDKSGFGAGFYAGKIHKNALINSLAINFVGTAPTLSSSLSLFGEGNVFKLDGDCSILAQSKDWVTKNSNDEFCFSVYVMSKTAENTITINSSDGYSYSEQIDDVNKWVRVHFNFNVVDNNKQLSFKLSGKGLEFTAPQLENGNEPTLYQPTDDKLNYTDEYGAWLSKGGIGGTIQNPLLKLNSDGSIESKGDGFKINKDGSGHLAGGALTFDDKHVNISFESSNIGSDMSEAIKKVDDRVTTEVSRLETNFEIKDGQISSSVKKVETLHNDIVNKHGEIADLEDSVKKAETNVTQTAEEISQKASEVKITYGKVTDEAAKSKENAELAQEKADSAKIEAESAKKSAGESSQSYLNAKEKAELAQKEADRAKEEADKIALINADVTEKYTEINQTAEEITTTATEVSKQVGVATEASLKAESEAVKASKNAEDANNKALEATGKAEEALASAGASSQSYFDAKAEADKAVKEALTATEKAKQANQSALDAQKALANVTDKETNITQTAEKITSIANEVSKNAETVEGRYTEITQTANNVNIKAQEVITNANKAQKEAERAKNISKEVSVKQSEIELTSEGIYSKAEEIDGVANDVLLAKEEAKLSANEAKREAEEAQVKANEATKRAEEALASAGASSQSYKNAQAEADKAVKEALTASEKADEALIQASIAEREAQRVIDAQRDVNDKYTEIIQTSDEVKLLAKDAETSAQNAKDIEASINLKADGIILEASEKSAHKAIDDLDIGARNLFLNSDFVDTKNKLFNPFNHDYNKGWVFKKNANLECIMVYNGQSLNLPSAYSSAYSSAYNSTYRNKQVDLMAYSSKALSESLNNEDIVSYQCMVYSDYETKICFSININNPIWYSVPANKWVLLKFENHTLNINNGDGDLYWYSQDNEPFYLTRIKVERGSKCTGWTRAPEDEIRDYKIADDRISNAEIRLEPDNIWMSVSESDGYDKMVSSFMMTKNGISFNGKHLDFTGEVTFSMLKDGDGDTLINGGKIKTDVLDVNKIVSEGIQTNHIEGLTLNFTKGKIGGWNISSSAITKNNVSLGSDGTIQNGSKWLFKNDGSGGIASNNIKWDTNGNVTFSDKVKLNWQKAIDDLDTVNRNYAYINEYNYIFISNDFPRNNKQYLSLSLWGNFEGFTNVDPFGEIFFEGNYDSYFLDYKYIKKSDNHIVFEGGYVDLSLETDKDLTLGFGYQGLEELITKVKVDLGKKATDWTPAPEDPIEIDQLGGTIITNNKIKTSLLNATEIVTNGLTAEHITGKNLNFKQGTIGGWTIDASKLRGKNVLLEADGGIKNTTGLWELNNDGSVKFGKDGEISLKDRKVNVGGFTIDNDFLYSNVTENGGNKVSLQLSTNGVSFSRDGDSGRLKQRVSLGSGNASAVLGYDTKMYISSKQWSQNKIDVGMIVEVENSHFQYVERPVGVAINMKGLNQHPYQVPAALEITGGVIKGMGESITHITSPNSAGAYTVQADDDIIVIDSPYRCRLHLPVNPDFVIGKIFKLVTIGNDADVYMSDETSKNIHLNKWDDHWATRQHILVTIIYLGNGKYKMYRD